MTEQSSPELKQKMRGRITSQSIADRVAETLNIIHDVPPLQPTGTAMEHKRKGTLKNYDPEGERDISMITQISKPMVFAVAFGKALETTDPCEARAKFIEQYLRSARSDKGWGIEKSIEMLKAVRPQEEAVTTKSRFERLKRILG